ncbi:MAG TPA: UDP-N-acetylmuramoyl-L-alanine--D-glutamate ligase [Acidobacteriota bacterium]|jgi:UDP-N-acetylmuramoylalanine--D-glutamate ligase
MEVAGKKVLVIGLARTGVAVVRFLLERGSEAVITDDKREADLGPWIEQLGAIRAKSPLPVKLYLGGTFPPPSEKPDLAVLSPGVPLSHPVVRGAMDAGVPVISEIELAYRVLKGRIVAVTGSNGKTTCTAMLGAMLAKRYPSTFISGNIGTPLISQVQNEDTASWHVVEVSSFQLETIDHFRPNVAVMLNLTPDHLDRHGSMDLYGIAKERIFKNQMEEDAAVLNADDARVKAMAPRVHSDVHWFSARNPVSRGAFVREGAVWLREGKDDFKVINIAEIPLRGSHNLENVLACTAAGFAAGVSPEQMALAVRDFKAVEHRLEFVTEIGAVSFFNDSKATNVDAAIKALEAFSEPLVVLMGGRDKGADFSDLRESVRQRVRHIVVIGEAAEKIAAALGDLKPISRAAGLEEAVRLGMEKSRPGDVVLLAPACASFDMFQDYEDRGRQFKAAVMKLKGQ